MHGLTPIPRARVRGKSWMGWYSAWVETDQNGYFSITCPPPGAGPAELEVFAENSDIVVHNRHPDRIASNTATQAIAYQYFSSIDCYNAAPTEVRSTSPYESELFHNLTQVVAQSRQAFGSVIHRGQLAAYFRQDLLHQGAAYYSYGDSAVFGHYAATYAAGQALAAHEYAHAVHATALHGLAGFQAGPNCLMEHGLSTEQTMGCAANEGFAVYFQVVSLGPHSVHAYAVSVNTSLDIGGGVRDGSRIEGAIAAFLYDLSDPVGNDTLALLSTGPVHFADGFMMSPGEVARVIRSCQIWSTGVPTNPVRANAVDHWAYCYERDLRYVTTWYCDEYSCYADRSVHRHTNPLMPQTYFPDRRAANQQPWGWHDGVSSFTIEPRPDVRQLWRCNLYAHCDPQTTNPMPWGY